MFSKIFKMTQTFSLLLSICLILFAQTIFSQPRIDGIYINSTTTAETNRSIQVIPGTFGDMTLLVGTNRGNLGIAKIRNNETISNRLFFKSLNFAPPSTELVREIYFDGNDGYVLKNNGIYYSDSRSDLWLKKSLIDDLPQITGSAAEIWSMGFAGNKRVCLAGVYLKKSSDRSIDKELLVCTDDITDKFPQWSVAKTPENSKFEQLQLTNIFFDNNQNGWAVGTDGEEGAIWYSTDKGKHWKELDSEIKEPLLSVSGAGYNLFAVGYNRTLLSNISIPNKNQNTTQNNNQTRKSEIKKGSKVEIITKFIRNLPLIDGIERIIGKVVEIKGDKLRVEITEVKPEIMKKQVKNYYEEKELDKSDVKIIEDDESEQKPERFDSVSSPWQPLNVSNLVANPNIALRSVKFASNNLDGFIVGDKGTILYTSDGGKRWQLLRVTTQLNTVDFYSMFLTDKYCWIVGSKGAVVRISYPN